MIASVERSQDRIDADFVRGIPTRTELVGPNSRAIVVDLAEIAQRRCLAMSCAEVIRTMAEDYRVEIVFGNDGRARVQGER